MESKEKKVAVQISELVRQLEEQSSDPKILDKSTLRECAVFLKNKGYSSTEIGHVLKVNERTIQRYMKEYRKKTRLGLGENFHQDFVGEIVNNMRLRCQRLWKLAYSGKLSAYEEARVICMIHQIEMNKVAVLERLGYLQESQGKDELAKAYDLSVEKREQQEVMRMLWFHDKRLTSEQIEHLNNYYIGEKRIYPHKADEIPQRMNLMINMLVGENEDNMKELKGVAAPGELRCRVFVINGLRN